MDFETDISDLDQYPNPDCRDPGETERLICHGCEQAPSCSVDIH